MKQTDHHQDRHDNVNINENESNMSTNSNNEQTTPLISSDESDSLISYQYYNAISISKKKEHEKDNSSSYNSLLMPSGSMSSQVTPPMILSEFRILTELNLLFKIALPTVAVQFFTFIIFPITASIVGRHLNTNDLAAFSLGSLSGNITCISVIIGTLTASETLQPRAFGMKQYHEVGIIAIRSFFVSIIALLVPITFLKFGSYFMFQSLGQNTEVALLASRWIQLYIYSVPFILLFRILQRFLAAQNIVLPCLVGSAIASTVVHPIIINVLIHKYHFQGSVIAIIITQIVQLLIAILYTTFTKSYVHGTMPQLKEWKQIIVHDILLDTEKLKAYAKLSLGGIMSLSEWWYWECTCFIAGKLGVIPLCVHSVTYQIIPLIYMIPLGISIGLSVRMGQLLSSSTLSSSSSISLSSSSSFRQQQQKNDNVIVNQTKVLVGIVLILVSILALVVTWILYSNQRFIVSMFTSDEDVIEGCSIIWDKVCAYVLGLYIFCINTGILRALGLQWQLAKCIFIVLWCFSLPCIIYVCIIQPDGSLDRMWTILFWSYIVLDITLVTCYVSADWNEISKRIKYEHRHQDDKMVKVIVAVGGSNNDTEEDISTTQIMDVGEQSSNNFL